MTLPHGAVVWSDHDWGAHVSKSITIQKNMLQSPMNLPSLALQLHHQGTVPNLSHRTNIEETLRAQVQDNSRNMRACTNSPCASSTSAIPCHDMI